MSNTFKREQKEEKREAKGFAPTRMLVALLNGELMQQEGFTKNISFMVYLVILLIAYLSYGYYAETSLRDLMKSDSKLKEKKAEYVTSKSILEQKKLQSKIAATVFDMGLVESTESPYKIVVDKSYFEKGN